MGRKPVHAVLGVLLLSGAMASGCRSNGGSAGSPGVVGSNNTPSPGAFGRDPGGLANASSSMRPASNGVSPASVYGSDTNPTLASSAASPAGTVREYSNGVNVADNGTVTNGRPTGWNSSPRSTAVVPAGGNMGSASPGNPYASGNNPPPPMNSGATSGVTPVSYQQSAPPPGAVPTNYPNPSASNFPSGGRDSFKEQPAMSGAGSSTMTFTPGTTSGDVGRTPPPQVEGIPGNGDYHSVPAGAGTTQGQ